MGKELMGKNILIFGGTGFLGKNLCRSLTRNGSSVTVYAKNKISELVNEFTKIKYIYSDYINETNFDKMLENIDVVFHLISTTNASNERIIREFQENVVPTIKLLDSCVKNGVKLVFFSSGGTVYGLPYSLPIDEKHRTEPISSYGIQKLSIEKCIEYYGHTYGLDYLILRISNPYGPYQNPFGNQGVISVFIANVLMGTAIEIWGDGSTIRDYIFVEDLMDACTKLVKYNGNNRVFNIGYGKGHSLKEIIEVIQKELKKKVIVNYKNSRVQDVTANVLDISLLKQEIDWTPSVSIEEGIHFMLNAWNPECRKFLYPER